MKALISLLFLLVPNGSPKELAPIQTAKRVYCLIGETDNIMLENIQYRIKDNGGYIIYRNSYLGMIEMNLTQDAKCLFKQ